MVVGKVKRTAWKKVIAKKPPVLLPAAHDALTARLIERAGFAAFQVGGFALVGARHGFPDIDLVQFDGEMQGVRDIIAVTSLPVLVDCDDGYGDVKNVTRTVREYESLGVSALFIEDQQAPKECGHMAHKKVVPVEVMEAKIRAAVAARTDPDTFLVARSDAIEPDGLDEALRRGERYLKAGANGLFLEGARSVEEIEKIGKTFKGEPLMVNMLEGGGKTPWVEPKELYRLGFSMILYPTSILFRVARTIEHALNALKAGRPMSTEEGVDFEEFEAIVDLPAWVEIDSKFKAKSR
jgi:2-methylisocitrate lyase-like PEP mutase family enzyme